MENLRLPRGIPEETGVSSAGILAFLDEVERRELELHGFMLLRHGRVIAEGWWAPYGPETPHAVYSVTKSFVSAAVGLAVEDGLVSVDDPVAKFFPEAEEAEAWRGVGAEELKVRHLLCMATGHTENTSRNRIEHSFLRTKYIMRIGNRPDGDWVRAFFDAPPQRPPGSHFVYNNGASHLLAQIVERVTGQNVLDYLFPRLLLPLGIGRPEWDRCPRGNIVGAWGMRLRTEDMARFGLLWLQKGIWRGKRILPESWVEEASSRQIDTNTGGEDAERSDYLQGYGYQFWRGRHNTYRADGAHGQFCIVMPDQDAVAAIHSGAADWRQQAVLDAVWRHLLPAMRDGELPADAASQALARRLGSLEIGGGFGPVGAGTGPDGAGGGMAGMRSRSLAAAHAGTVKRYRLEPNDLRAKEIAFDFRESGCRITWTDDDGTHALECGMGEWNHGNELNGEAAAAKLRWQDELTFVVDVCRVNTPFHESLTCRLEGDRIRLVHRDLLKESRLAGGAV
jgi:CubicO group peptidase (beta-lactamase class C family)